jgi:hypothetical protein
MMSIYTRVTENDKKLIKLRRGELSFVLCYAYQRKRYQTCGKSSTRKDGEKGTEWVGNPEGKIIH